ncbi:MAG TPA: diacylglycerol kinase family protein [Chroococcales cyanobacterium]
MRYKAHNLFASFRYALDGVFFSLRTQRNMRVHFSVGLGAFILALFLKIGLFEIAVVSTATAGVIAAEMFNTAIENAVDLATHRRHPLAKAAKDTAAAAVLLTALNAFAVGCLILLPPLIRLFR